MTNERFPKISNARERIISACSRIDDSHESETADLAEYFASIGALTAAALSDPGYVVQVEAGGYIRVTIDTLPPIFIPPHLAPDVADAAALRQLVALAMTISVGAGGRIHISGSALMSGTYVAIGDVDFCEYLSGEKLNQFAAEQTMRDIEPTAPCCFRVTCFDSGREAHRWTEAWTSPSPQEWDPILRLKCDYVAKLEGHGSIEVTNLSLGTPAHGESFEYQQAGIDTCAWLPETLLSFDKLVVYVRWLRGEITDLLAKDSAGATIKAAKRALSLGRILWLRDEVDALLDTLPDSVLASAAAAARNETATKVEEKATPALRSAPYDDIVAGLRRTASELEPSVAPPPNWQQNLRAAIQRISAIVVRQEMAA